MSTLAREVCVAVVVTAVALVAYEALVRRPATPRIAMVDVTTLHQAAQQAATRRALDLAGSERGGTDAELVQVEKAATDFGPRLTRVLNGLAGECNCTVVAMAAVHGADSAIPDFTAVAAERLHLELLP